MIPNDCKRLAEVEFPIAKVGKYALRENSSRGSHPKSLHLWWARRPLTACRAILWALLMPDPADPKCPDAFIGLARTALKKLGVVAETRKDLRDALVELTANIANPEALKKGAIAEVVTTLLTGVSGDDAPLLVDSFSGGGSIPIEGTRLGCDVFAFDLNPVAILILRAVLEEIPKGGAALIAAYQAASKEVAEAVSAELSYLFPSDDNGQRPTAYFWARTLQCESCGATFPLVRSFWLSKPRKIAIRFEVIKDKIPRLTFHVFSPTKPEEVSGATVYQAKATCPCCNNVHSPTVVRSQLRKRNGGIEDCRLLAVATQHPTGGSRSYRAPKPEDELLVAESLRMSSELAAQPLFEGIPVLPNEEIPNTELRRISAPLYGCDKWVYLFTPRQRVSVSTLCKHIRNATERHRDPRIGLLLALAAGKVLRHWNSNAKWHNGSETVAGAFGRQAIPMSWSFPEQTVWAEGAGSLSDAFESVAMAASSVLETKGQGSVQQADAASLPLPSDSAQVWFTDPPYYDAVAYAHLSDFFYVWLKRSFPEASPYRSLLKSSVVDKKEECVVDRPHKQSPSKKDRVWFEAKISAAMAEGRRILADDGIGCVVFAHKTTEGWEALIGGMLKGGWVITASWPIETERSARLNARDNASLASSVHLICRPRSSSATVGDWGEVLRELPNRIAKWMNDLSVEGVRGADLVFACIGPAMEIYSRYRRVEDAEGREIPLGGDATAIEPYKRGYLAYVWETVGRLALEQVLGTAEAKARNGTAGALEEDSRLTALFLWTLQATDVETNGDDAAGDDSDDDDGDEEVEKPKKKKAGFSLIYDVARRFAQPLGIHLDKWEGRIIETEKGVVRLLPVSERATQLFGEADASTMAHRIEQDVKASRNYAFAFMQDVAAPPEIKPRGRGKAKGATISEAPAPQMVTTLDRLHAAMLLQSSGQSNGLRAMLKEEQQRGPDFLRLANALSALYPKDSEEKRLLDAMLLAVPRN